ncbi:MAG TPA: CxxxxCH/CxxCH domain-containing protein, partial [Anaeromyxobacteraceae bacterium]|nr:CxxxxCH/CxxCH domain-containing protein [Anaeromyxobacteraceae bacterium]
TSTPTTAPPVYAFGCGHCHPLDQVKHLDGAVEVEVYDAAAPAGSLKARASPAAAYSGGLDGTCSGTYCHSSGQETPSWTKPRDGAAIASPAWSSGQSLGCTGCHDNPPAYPSGGPGAPDANGHVGLRDDGYVWGHFGGLPGPSLYSKHGKLGFGDDASPITCQTCHVDTVDPANTGPSAFYYLDTTGDYTFGGGVLDDACAVCHTGGGATTGTGRILPLRHVNGTRDVVFDARTSLPQGISWLPAAPNRPSRPYWASNASLSSYPPDTSGFDGTTFSLTLGASGVTPAASYDAPTKTCSSVACHLDSTGPVWGTGYATSGPASGCADCHHF